MRAVDFDYFLFSLVEKFRSKSVTSPFSGIAGNDFSCPRLEALADIASSMTSRKSLEGLCFLLLYMA